MENWYKNHKDIPRKLEIVEEYFANEKLTDTVKVLDIGGTLYYYSILETIFKPGKVYLLNIYPKSVKGVSRSVVGDGTQLPFKDETWDIITSFDLIEHLVNPDDFLAESFRVLKWGGWFIISAANLGDFYSRITFLFGYIPFNYNPSKFRVATPFSKIETNMGHKSVFTFRGLKELLLINRFKILKSYGYSYTSSFYLKLDPEKKRREVGFYRFRRIFVKLLPIGCREGMLFIGRKEKVKK